MTNKTLVCILLAGVVIACLKSETKGHPNNKRKRQILNEDYVALDDEVDSDYLGHRDVKRIESQYNTYPQYERYDDDKTSSKSKGSENTPPQIIPTVENLSESEGENMEPQGFLQRLRHWVKKHSGTAREAWQVVKFITGLVLETTKASQ